LENDFGLLWSGVGIGEGQLLPGAEPVALILEGDSQSGLYECSPDLAETILF
jgi:hypothetical protein